MWAWAGMLWAIRNWPISSCPATSHFFATVRSNRHKRWHQPFGLETTTSASEKSISLSSRNTERLFASTKKTCSGISWVLRLRPMARQQSLSLHLMDTRGGMVAGDASVAVRTILQKTMPLRASLHLPGLLGADAGVCEYVIWPFLIWPFIIFCNAPKKVTWGMKQHTVYRLTHNIEA